MTQAVAILRFLAAQRTPSGVIVIARSLGISPSSCFNILKVLTGEGFVSFDEAKKSYALGSGAIALARHALDPESAGYIGRDVLIDLADAFEATSTLWRIKSEKVLLVALEAGDQAPPLRIRIGQRRPIMLGANGRAILAASPRPPEDLKQKFAALRWETPPTFETYMDEVATAGRAGWAVDDGALMRGMTSVAAAVTRPSGDPHFSIAVTLLSGPYKKAFLDKVGKATAEAARRLELKLFGDDPGRW